MHILMGFNSKFLIPALVTIYSLFINNDNVVLHIFYNTLSKADRECIKITERIGNKQKIIFQYIDNDTYKNLRISHQYPLEIYYRFMAYSILDDSIEKVLWLDSDIIVKSNIRELYELDMEGKSFAAVGDNSSNPKERLGLQQYVNSGVLLMNLSKLRSENRMETYWKFVSDKEYMSELPDQDALNIIFERDIKIVTALWNYPPFANITQEEESEKLYQQVNIIHYLSKCKPWELEWQNYWVKISEKSAYTKKCYILYMEYLETVINYLEQNFHLN